jgi:hypothetical protein
MTAVDQHVVFAEMEEALTRLAETMPTAPAHEVLTACLMFVASLMARHSGMPLTVETLHAMAALGQSEIGQAAAEQTRH